MSNQPYKEYVFITGIKATEQALFEKKLKDKIKTTTKCILITASKDLKYKKDVIEKSIRCNILTGADNDKLPEKDHLPKKIRVIYLQYNDGDSELFESLFYPFADIQKITLNSNRPKAEQLAEEFSKVIRNGLVIKQLPAKKSCLVLPVKNFKVKKGCFSTLLRKYYFDAGVVKTQTVEGKVKNDLLYNHQNYCWEDSRGLLFIGCKRNEGELWNADELKYTLMGVYRLGWKFDSGFHFDVKHKNNRCLCGITLTDRTGKEEKITKKKVMYANIYMNDHIRFKK